MKGKAPKGVVWTATIILACSLGYLLQAKQQVRNYSGAHAVARPTTKEADQAATRNISDASNATLPWLVMYVGPGKTGTTTMQHIISGGVDKLLAQDNYVYLGRRTRPTRWSPILEPLVPQAWNSITGDEDNISAKEEYWMKNFLPVLEELISEGRNLLVYEEFLSGSHVDYDLLQRVVRNRYHVVIVVGYRRTWDWLASWKNEWEKKCKKQWPTRSLTLEESTTLPAGTAADARRPVPSPPYFKMAAYAGGVGGEDISKTIRSLKRHLILWKFAQFRILNVHQEDMISRFFCEVLPDAPRTCAQSRKRSFIQEFVGSRTNPSKNLDEYMIANAAADRELLNKTLVPVQRAASAISTCMEKLRPLPVDCLDDESMKRLLENSIETEKEIVANFSSTCPHLLELTEAGHREHFRKSSYKFCSPDVESILNDERWLRCFSRINQAAGEAELGMVGTTSLDPGVTTGNTTIPDYLPVPYFEFKASTGPRQGQTCRQTIPPSMFAVEGGKILYCPAAKAGSSTLHSSWKIERCFDYPTYKKSPPPRCNRLVSVNFWSNETLRRMVVTGSSISLTHVRNPWDRIWSTYRGKIANGLIEIPPFSTGHVPSFVEFLDAVAEDPSGNIHWQPFSTRCLTSADNQGRVFRYDHVLRMEDNFVQNLTRVAKLAGLSHFEVIEKQFNYTGHSVSKRRDFYQTEANRSGLQLSEVVAKVYQIYQDDIKTFNYSFDRYG